jgi:dCMP deaminase
MIDLFLHARHIKWDVRFLHLAQIVALWSKDPSTKVGAVIVRPDMTVASQGYNGFPKGMSDAPTLYEVRDEKYSRIIHAEMNALLHCREEVVGYDMFCSLLPCERCLVHAIQKGIRRFIAPMPSLETISRWGSAFDKTRSYAAEMGLELVEYDMSKFPPIQGVSVSA